MKGTANSTLYIALLAAMHALCPPAAALDFESSVSGGVNYTNNVRRTSSDEEDDWIALANIGASLSDTGGPLEARVDTSLSYNDYLNDTFGKQTYFRLGSALDWEQIPNRLRWDLSDNFTQTSVETTGPDTPTNTQNFNVFNAGAEVIFPVTGRHTFTISPVYSDFYYEETDADNQRYSLSGSWDYLMYPTFSVGLKTGISEVRYDDSDLNPDYTSTSYQARVSGTRPRSNYSLSLGMTKVERDNSPDQDGMSGQLNWLYNLSGVSSLRAFITSDITDSSEDYYTSVTDPDTGDYANVQVSGDVLRSDTLRITYNRAGTIVIAKLYLELRDLDYKESPDDREVTALNGSLTRRVSPVISAGLVGRYTKTERTDINTTDKLYKIGGDISFSLSRKLAANLNLSYQDKNATDSVDEYTEFSVFAGISYNIFQ